MCVNAQVVESRMTKTPDVAGMPLRATDLCLNMVDDDNAGQRPEFRGIFLKL